MILFYSHGSSLYIHIQIVEYNFWFRFTAIIFITISYFYCCRHCKLFLWKKILFRPFLCFNFDWLFKPVLVIYKIFEKFSRLLSLWVYYFYPPYRFILDFTFLGFDLKFKLLSLLATCVWFYGIQNCPSAVYFAVCCLYFFFRSQSGFLFSWYYSSKINTIRQSFSLFFSVICVRFLFSSIFQRFNTREVSKLLGGKKYRNNLL